MQDKNDAYIARAKAEGIANSNPLKRSVGYSSDSDDERAPAGAGDEDVEMNNAKRPKTSADGLVGEVANIQIRK